MRDPERIDPFLEKLGAFWKTVPDWRFGQLIMNLSRNDDNSFPDTWEWEESEWEKKIEEAEKADYHEPTDEEIEARVEAILKKIDLVNEIYKKHFGRE